MTLVELMVSIVLALILTGGLFYMMSGQQRTYANQLSALTSQQNVWGAMEYLQTQVRMAGFGFGGCPNGEIKFYNSGSPTTLSAIKILNKHNLYSGQADGSDSFSVTYSDYVGGAVESVRLKTLFPPPTGVAANLEVKEPGTVKGGDLLILYEPGTDKHCSIILSTHDPYACNASGCFLQYNPGSAYNPPGPKKWDLFPAGGYGENTQVIRAGNTSAPRNFAINRSLNPPLLVTWTAADKSDLEVVAEGIEDMQLAWACDANGNGIFEEDPASPTTDEWAYTVPGDSAATEPACGGAPIGIVRITLIARSPHPVAGERGGFRPAAEDRAAGPLDETIIAYKGSYGRAVLTATVKPRNLRSGSL